MAPLMSSTVALEGSTSEVLVSFVRVAMGGVTSDYVDDRNGYGNTDAHDEQRRGVPDEAQFQSDRPISDEVYTHHVEGPASLQLRVTRLVGTERDVAHVRARISTNRLSEAEVIRAPRARAS